MRYGSLFTGIGGIDLGLDMAGMECVWQVEVDDYCTQVLEKRWPNATRYRDIFELNGKELESVDLICGGFPCQPVSVAGRRGGTSDERWLWGEFARIIRQVKPRWVVAENVTGLLSANSGRAFAEVLRDLAEGGYNVVWDVFPAGGQGGVGAPHKRERIFIVAYSDGSRWDAQSLSRTIRNGGKNDTNIDQPSEGLHTGIVADTDSKRHRRRAGEKRRITKRELQQKEQERSKVGCETEGCCESHGNVSNSDGERLERKERKRKTGKKRKPEGYSSQRSQWATEPDVGRVADGIPKRVDRLKALGNAVVPQVAKQIGEMILDTDN